MYFPILLHLFNKNNVYYYNKIKNSSYFTRIFYDAHFYTSNGIYLKIPNKYVLIDKSYNQTSLLFSHNNIANVNIFNQLHQIESYLLNNYIQSQSNNKLIPLYAFKKEMKCVNIYTPNSNSNLNNNNNNNNNNCINNNCINNNNNNKIIYKIIIQITGISELNNTCQIVYKWIIC